MRIVLHGGLHKSGTTTVQHGWRQAYGGSDRVWYPTDPAAKLPGHHALVWPLLVGFTERRANDLVWGATLSRRRTNLTQTVADAERNGVDVLLVSSEELDRFAPPDVDRFAAMFACHQVTFVLTVTRPMHRWCSGWQELVKHGLAEYPRDAAADVQAFASLGVGRLAELVRLVPAQERIVRVVRTAPPEDRLARDLAELCGLTWPDVVDDAGPSPRNVSMGADAEILRRLNAADLTLGTVHGDGRRLIARLKAAGTGGYVDRPDLAARYEPPEQFWAAADAERRFLVDEAAAAGVHVADPHGLLADWLDARAPDWYREISCREADLPVPAAPVSSTTALWRARQERAALQVLLARAEEQLTAVREQVAVTDAKPGREPAGKTKASGPPARLARFRRIAGRVRRRLRRTFAHRRQRR